MHTPNTVLVVDDDVAIRQVLTMVLTDEGYRVVTAANELDALDYLRAGSRPGLIVLDLKMPIMNGQEFRAEQLRDPDLAPIPVAVITAHVTKEVTAEIPAEAFLPKPLDFDRLMKTVARYCSG